jgi:hypothetical protein
MATANLTLPNGTTVTIEGTADEVAVLLSKCSGAPISAGGGDQPVTGKKKPGSSKGKRSRRKGPQTFIEELANEGYFESKKTIGEVQAKLEGKGHIYAQANLSPALLKLTRDKHVLRRLKEKNGWVYVNN